jgi:uncharacterized protein YcfJ
MRFALVAAAGTAVLLALAQNAAAQLYPSVPASPPPGKPYAMFQQDDAVCQQFANSQVAYAQQQAGNQVAGGAVGGAVGGALIGGILGGGRGAAIGAGAGAVAGGTAGAANAQATGYYAQQRFDATYRQCMASRGDMPLQAQPVYQPGFGAPPPPPPPGSAPLQAGAIAPPPPPGAAPMPPPGAAPDGNDDDNND